MCIILIVNDIAYSLWCYDGLPPPPGWQLGAPSGGPRMSPRPCVAKYGATHSANHLPGLEITSPFVIIRYKRSIDDGIQTQTRLRRTWRSAAFAPPPLAEIAATWITYSYPGTYEVVPGLEIYKSLRAKGTPLVEQCDAAKLQRHRPKNLHSAPFPAF